jgi:hypothetical protein
MQLLASKACMVAYTLGRSGVTRKHTNKNDSPGTTLDIAASQTSLSLCLCDQGTKDMVLANHITSLRPGTFHCDPLVYNGPLTASYTFLSSP